MIVVVFFSYERLKHRIKSYKNYYIVYCMKVFEININFLENSVKYLTHYVIINYSLSNDELLSLWSLPTQILWKKFYLIFFRIYKFCIDKFFV